jgi:restriction endonuclease S subunit
MFRTAIKNVPDGSFRVVQVRDVLIENGKPVINWKSLAQVNIETSRVVRCLQNGQLLVIAKGEEKHVIKVENMPSNVVCTQHFLTIEPKDEHVLDMDFVEFILTSDISKKWLINRSGGSYQSVLSKSILEEMPFPKVTIEMQIKAVALKHSLEKEELLYKTLFNAHSKMKSKLVSNWLDNGNSENE